MSIENNIRTIFMEVLEMSNSTLIGELEYDTVLLESGLDSLGFAILVARLDEELGYDPFTLMTEVVYPRTFKDFVRIYNDYKPS